MMHSSNTADQDTIYPSLHFHTISVLAVLKHSQVHLRATGVIPAKMSIWAMVMLHFSPHQKWVLILFRLTEKGAAQWGHIKGNLNCIFNHPSLMG